MLPTVSRTSVHRLLLSRHHSDTSPKAPSAPRSSASGVARRETTFAAVALHTTVQPGLSKYTRRGRRAVRQAAASSTRAQPGLGLGRAPRGRHRTPECLDPLVEDEPDSREVIAAQLHGCGAQVKTAESAAAGFDLIQHEHFDVLCPALGVDARAVAVDPCRQRFARQARSPSFGTGWRA